jgi:hypothetical protein
LKVDRLCSVVDGTADFDPIRKFWLFELGSGPAEIIVVWTVMPRRFIPDEQARNGCGAGEHSVGT